MKMTKSKLHKLIATIKGWGLELYEKRDNYLRFRRTGVIGVVVSMFANEWEYYLVNEVSMDYDKWQHLVDKPKALEKLIDELTMMNNWAKDLKKKMREIAPIYDLKEIE